MKTLILSHRRGLATSGESVKQSQTSTTNQKRRWGKRAWDRAEKVSVRCFWVIASIMSVIMFVGFFRVYTFGQDGTFVVQWYDEPARWVLTQIMSESPTIDPDKMSIFSDFP